MKKKVVFLILLLLTAYILCCPKAAVAASRDGLLLWYERVLPTLLPAAILSNILITSGYAAVMTAWLSGLLSFLPVSQYGLFVLFCGFLFGFPMGSKCSAELLKAGKIEEPEASVLFCITNNISPAFIGSYLLLQELKLPDLFPVSLLLLYVPALVLGVILLYRNPPSASVKSSSAPVQINFQILDAGIMNGFETLVKIGGYIMLFSILTSLVGMLPLPPACTLLLSGTLEITTGIHLLAASRLPVRIKYILAMAFTAFGGISGIAQTSSMVKGTSLSMKKYCKVKLCLTLCSLILAVFISYLML